jgi:hypothetical protein
MPVRGTIGTASKPLEKPATPPKLSPPRSEGLVSRSRLLKQMDQSGGVVTIVGGPVIGKTCLAASWMSSALLSNRSMDMFWYRIDDADRDVATFFQVINDVAAKRLPPRPKLPAYSVEADLRGFTVAWIRAGYLVKHGGAQPRRQRSETKKPPPIRAGFLLMCIKCV